MLLIGGILASLLAILHSILGERLIFVRLREGGGWSSAALNVLEPRRWRAIRATWHLVSILGAGLAAMLFDHAAGGNGWILLLGVTFAVSALYWATATRLEHPAWLVFAVLGGLLIFGRG